MTYGIASGIVDNRRTAAHPRCCPRHQQALTGGPVVYRCPAGHRVQAADLDQEVPQ